MVEWVTIISLILIGAFLVIAEILFIPGIFIVGSLGVGCSAYSIYLSYQYFDRTTATLILLATIAINVVSFILAFRGKTWQRFSLKQTHGSKVNDEFKIELKVGDVGKTISKLKPVGKALFGDTEIEVRSKGKYIDENVEIEIEKIDSSKIFIKTVN